MPRSDEHRDDNNLWLDDAAGPVVRPYAMTSGRTRPTTEFDLIALVVAMRHSTVTDAGLGPEHLAIIRMCQRPISVAEIAAHLDLPIGIIRVLLGDLVDRELVFVRVPQPASEMPTEEIFKAVINGLRAL